MNHVTHKQVCAEQKRCPLQWTVEKLLHSNVLRKLPKTCKCKRAAGKRWLLQRRGTAATARQASRNRDTPTSRIPRATVIEQASEGPSSPMQFTSLS